MTFNWTRFEKQVFIKAPGQVVFDAWAIPNELVKWFIAEADYTMNGQGKRGGTERIGPGDQYHWRWHQDLATTGVICDVVSNEQIRFTFGKQSPKSDTNVIVTVQVEELEDGYTKLSLTQENMTDSEYGRHYHLSCNLGWSFFMTNLKGLLEHGIDLREKHPDRVEAARAISVS